MQGHPIGANSYRPLMHQADFSFHFQPFSAVDPGTIRLDIEHLWPCGLFAHRNGCSPYLFNLSSSLSDSLLSSALHNARYLFASHW